MKSIASRKLFYKIISGFLIALILGLGFFSVQQTYQTNASDVFTEKVVDNGKFSMTINANARRQTALPLDERHITNSIGEDINYLCFKWRDIEHLKFRFGANIKGSDKTFQSYKFLLTNLQTDDLQTSIGVKEPTILYQGNISNNVFSSFDFYYFVDKNTDITESATRTKGNDFGIYKFDFVYTFLEDEAQVSVSIGDVYIAILPDDVDLVPQSDIRIMYSISSSNKLMNIFNLYLSNDNYKYVNPKYLQWVVVGTDQMNVSYVLTQKMKDDNINYANYKVVWQSLINTNGTSFIFDSNDVEGTWTAYCYIKHTDGSEKVNLSVNNLSTIKVETKSYVWLILLVLGCAMLLGGIIALIVFYKKRDKVW